MSLLYLLFARDGGHLTLTILAWLSATAEIVLCVTEGLILLLVSQPRWEGRGAAQP